MFINKDDSKALNSIEKILLHNLQKKYYLREKNIQFLNLISNTKEYIHDVYMDVDIDYNTQDNTQGDTQGNTQGNTQGDDIKKSVEFSKSPIVKESAVSQVLNNITDFIFN